MCVPKLELGTREVLVLIIKISYFEFDFGFRISKPVLRGEHFLNRTNVQDTCFQCIVNTPVAVRWLD